MANEQTNKNEMEENNQAKGSNPLLWNQKNIRENQWSKNFKDLENKERRTQIAGTRNGSLQPWQSSQYQEDNKEKYK
jgi:hypothetical protein